MSEIKAIETYYKGYRFRSRLEARWAVFFDAAGIKYEYEPEGFEFYNFEKRKTDRYLPDFFLPQFGCYAEVKPSIEKLMESKSKISYAIVSDDTPIGKSGLLILGQIPYCREKNVNPKFMIYHSEDGVRLDIATIAKTHDLGASLLIEQIRCLSPAPNLPTCFLVKNELYGKSVGTSTLVGDFRYELADYLWFEINEFLTPCYKKARQARFEFGARG